MSSWMILGVDRLRNIGLIGIFLSAVPFGLWSQEGSLPQQTPSSAVRSFARFDDSLRRAADTLLVSSALATIPATSKKNSEGLPVSALAKQVDPPSRPWVESGLSPAAIRLNLLRPVVEPILRSHGVPTDFAAVVLVESGGQTAALSPKGARGFWQLMPDTARRYGLRVDEIRDDRLNLFRATDAAARYLHDLYGRFGDWKLALAAYNTGEANVGSAILRAHSRDFDQLTNLRMLPLETRNYVPRVLAAAQFIEPFSTFADDRRQAGAITVFAVSNH
jgi:Transglycosylase SLT domain